MTFSISSFALDAANLSGFISKDILPASVLLSNTENMLFVI
jgi:hypothetical protein